MFMEDVSKKRICGEEGNYEYCVAAVDIKTSKAAVLMQKEFALTIISKYLLQGQPRIGWQNWLLSVYSIPKYIIRDKIYSA